MTTYMNKEITKRLREFAAHTDEVWLDVLPSDIAVALKRVTDLEKVMDLIATGGYTAGGAQAAAKNIMSEKGHNEQTI